MCSFIFLISNKKINKKLFFDSNTFIQSRGPNNTNSFFWDEEQFNIATVHNLLDISGYSVKQPLYEKSSKVLLFNGEIYKPSKNEMPDTKLLYQEFCNNNLASFLANSQGEFAISAVDLKKRTIDSKKFIFPNSCPSCGSKVVKDFNKISKKYDAVKRCVSEGYKCEKIAIEKIKHFVSKEAFNIEGLGKKAVEKFWELKFIKLPFDIFSLNYKKIEKLEGWGELSANNLKKSIEKSKNIGLDKFIFSLGIRHIGQENARLLSQHFLNIKNFNNLAKNFNFKSLANLDGIGETQIKSLKKFFENKSNFKIIVKLSSILTISDLKLNKDGILLNNTFMFTGKLTSMSRAEAKSLVEENSGSVVSSVNKKLKYLIIGEKPTKRKIERAKELGIKILSQKEWLNLLN